MGARKKFNITGICIPQKHYMADLDPKLEQIITQYIENEEYFTINRARHDKQSKAIWKNNNTGTVIPAFENEVYCN